MLKSTGHLCTGRVSHVGTGRVSHVGTGRVRVK